jgi:hypothetical protein
MRALLLSLGLLVGLALPLSAQTTPTVNPSQAVFTASASHSLTLPDGTPLVTGYRLRVLDDSTGATVRTTELGRPAPAASGDISVPLTSTGLQPNKTYRFTVDVLWSGGVVGAAAPSNPFYYVGAPSPATNLRAQ